MGLLLIAIAGVIAVGFFLMRWSTSWATHSDGFLGFLAFLGGCLGISVGFIGLCFYNIFAYDYFAAEYKANIINREYGTNYTQIEVFYASDVIEIVRQLDRKRFEVNGDLMKGKH